jgi:hypothetical protein
LLGITHLKHAFLALNQRYTHVLPWAKKITAAAKRAQGLLLGSAKSCTTAKQHSSLHSSLVMCNQKLGIIGGTLQVLQKQYQRISSAVLAFKSKADALPTIPDPHGLHQLYFDLQAAEAVQRNVLQTVNMLFAADSSRGTADLLEEPANRTCFGLPTTAVLGWGGGLLVGALALRTGAGPMGNAPV